MNQQNQMVVLNDTHLADIHQQLKNGTITVQPVEQKTDAQQPVGKQHEYNPEDEAAWATPAHGIIQGADIGSQDAIGRWVAKKADQGVSALAQKAKGRANAAVAY